MAQYNRNVVTRQYFWPVHYDVNNISQSSVVKRLRLVGSLIITFFAKYEFARERTLKIGQYFMKFRQKPGGLLSLTIK